MFIGRGLFSVLGAVKGGCSMRVLIRSQGICARCFSKDVSAGLALSRVLSCLSISGGFV